MWLFTVRKARPSTSARRVPARRPLLLEPLEDRCLLNAGALDPTFGNGAGYVTTSLNGGGDGQQVLVQPSGNIVIAGSSNGGTAFSVVTYNPDGSLDTAFGSKGVVTQMFPEVNKSPGYADLYDAVLEPMATGDSKILLAGNDLAQGGLALMRLNPNGSLDTTFGGNGYVITPIQTGASNTSGEYARAVAVTSSGQILVMGEGGGAGTVLLARYSPNGTLDPTFGSGGTATTVLTPPYLIVAMAQQPDGKFLVAGTETIGSGTAPRTKQGVVLRYNANGSLDTTFGNGGIVTAEIPFGSSPSAVGYTALAVDPNTGNIVVAGSTLAVTSGDYADDEWAVVRYTPNGSLDTTFGNGTGYVFIAAPQVPFQDDSANAVAIESGGQLIVVGYDTNGGQVARLTVNGSLDATFGNGGLVMTSIGAFNAFNGVAIQPDGKILAAGSVDSGSGDFLVARYLPQATSPYFVITGSSSLTAGTAGSYTVTAENADGSLDSSYTGTVHFTSSDPQAVLPADYTFTAADQGVDTFSATFKTAGSQSLTATDTTTPTMTGVDMNIQVSPGAATHFSISGPSSIKSGSSFSLIVTALDAYGNIATGYTGTIKFTDSVSGATLPSSYTFTATDAGVHTFTGLKLKTKGTQTITITDTVNSTIVADLTITVS